ncbi:MAG: Sfum_1244 family protein [Desulfurivibrionaceae bacterium]
MDLQQTIRHNCDISDARDNGIYSLCTLVLKLRNLYKWEQGLEPWDEPESKVLLDWIDAKENYWEEIAGEDLLSLPLAGTLVDPFNIARVNQGFPDQEMYYGAGYGRSLKSIFFLGEVKKRQTVQGIPVLILGREKIRELSAPFALLQDGVIIIRREPLRFFIWDQVQEIRAASRLPLRFALECHGVQSGTELNQQAFKKNLDRIVDEEIPVFIQHEIGELREKTLNSEAAGKLIRAYPDSVIELTVRAVKDILADTHPDGMLSHIINERREASLGFYLGFLDGMRKLLFPEIIEPFNRFRDDRDWRKIERARDQGRAANLRRAEILSEAAMELEHQDAMKIKCRIEKEILKPLEL